VSELEQKLEDILGDPQAMSQIMALAQSLSQTGQGGGGQAPTQPKAQRQGEDRPPEGEAPPPNEDAPAPPEGLDGLLGGLDAGTLSAAAQLLGRFADGGDDRRTALLAALRPYVREERYAKLDKAIQIAKLSRLIRGGLELLRQREEGGHV